MLENTKINADLMPVPADKLNDLHDRITPLNLLDEQMKDETIREVLEWKKGQPAYLNYKVLNRRNMQNSSKDLF